MSDVSELVSGLREAAESDETASYALCMEAADTITTLQSTVSRLREALEALFADYKQLADSGDAGFWSLEETDVGKQAMEALKDIAADGQVA